MHLASLLHQLDFVERWATGPVFMGFLLSASALLTLYLGFPQVRHAGRSLGLMLGLQHSKTAAKGDASPLQALAASLGSSIGMGNVTGTAIAIHIGGPSSVLWMLLIAFLGMSLKLSEVFLCHRYRSTMPDGTLAGGPMFVLKNRLNKPRLGVLAAVALLLAGLGGGNLSQANGMVNTLTYSLQIPKLNVLLPLTAGVALVIIGGIRRIGQVAEALIPGMALLYFGLAITVLIAHRAKFIPALVEMFTHLWQPNSALGGFLGGSVYLALWQGAQKSFFASDLGDGISGTIHAAAKNENAMREGLSAMLEPCCSVMFVSLLSALVILVTGSWSKKQYHRFSYSDLYVLQGHYKAEEPVQRARLQAHLTQQQPLSYFSGSLPVHQGKIAPHASCTLLHARSLAEGVSFTQQGIPFTGMLHVHQGRIAAQKGLYIYGKSLLQANNLLVHSFQQSPLKHWGGYLLTLCLILFAFTTVTAGYYFTDRALAYLLPHPIVARLYQFVFVGVFLIGGLVEVSIIWKIAGIAMAGSLYPMTIAILSLRREVKTALEQYTGQ